MPLYEYKCQECGLRFERIERASELRDGVCPDCGEVAHRLIGAPALQFKGSGWYVTDYGKADGSAPTAKETEKAQAAATSPTETKPEKKAEKKADAKVA